MNIEYGFPARSGDCIGEMALELLARTMEILKHSYKILARALYDDADENADDIDWEQLD